MILNLLEISYSLTFLRNECIFIQDCPFILIGANKISFKTSKILVKN